MSSLENELKKLEKKYGKGKFEIDEEHQLIKKKNWKCTSGLESLGQDTVAQMIADAEGTTFEKAEDKLKKAKEAHDKKE